MRYLQIEDALVLAERMGLVARDVGLLASAVGRPGASAFGEEIYPTLHHKIASLIHGINRNHPMVDGNKRLSWMCAVAFARINYFDLRGSQDEIYDMVIGVAEGNTDVPELSGWVESHLHARV
ncbi:MAG: type II toxin-antitoxin system death-on-curing family toxin [Candidatus Nanopelagicales bacterium]|nr:type II toxin-antitoxin system death-on-curing family toxin [Candidatus Nanopelagicales bacterium]MCF8551283.1 type II toxin-antitoxin system death-on-curing family toxin [Candidatus Nanopelagicales bacterium]